MIGLLDGLVAGAIAELALGTVAMFATLLMSQGLLWPVTNIGYMFQPATDRHIRGDTGIITKGLVIHMIVTMMLGLLFTLVVPFLPQFLPLWDWGMLFGVLIWIVDVAGLLRIIDPTMAENFSIGLFFFTHLVFGGVLGWWLKLLP